MTGGELLRKLNQILGKYEKVVGIKAVGSEGVVLKTDPQGRLILVCEAHAGTHETGGGDLVHFADLEHDEGDPTLHDAFTATPHISQAEKDKIHDRLHALDSALDHSGTITDSQHGIRGSGLHTDSHPQLHKDSHKTGGGDAFVLSDLLDCLARIEAKKAGTSIGKRRGMNFIEGPNITITMSDDPTNEEVDITISSTAGPTKITLVIDETEVSVTGTTESLFSTLDKTFDFIKDGTHLNLTLLRVLLQMKVDAGYTGTIKIYVDSEATPRLTFTTTSSAYEVKSGSTDISGLSPGLHTLTIKGYTNDATKKVYLRLYHVMGEA